MTETQNPTAPVASVRSDIAYRAGSGSDLTTTNIAVNRLRARFGLSEHVAALVAELAGLGRQAVRS
jgi:hypothetical protein